MVYPFLFAFDFSSFVSPNIHSMTAFIRFEAKRKATQPAWWLVGLAAPMLPTAWPLAVAAKPNPLNGLCLII